MSAASHRPRNPTLAPTGVLLRAIHRPGRFQGSPCPCRPLAPMSVRHLSSLRNYHQQRTPIRGRAADAVFHRSARFRPPETEPLRSRPLGRPVAPNPRRSQRDRVSPPFEIALSPPTHRPPLTMQSFPAKQRAPIRPAPNWSQHPRRLRAAPARWHCPWGRFASHHWRQPGRP